MTITHLSHFDLTLIGKTDDNVVLEGSLAACKRMAAAHGLEVVGYEGFIVASDECSATYTPADANNFSRILLSRGMIQRGQDNFCLVMPADVWAERV